MKKLYILLFLLPGFVYSCQLSNGSLSSQGGDSNSNGNSPKILPKIVDMKDLVEQNWQKEYAKQQAKREKNRDYRAGVCCLSCWGLLTLYCVNGQETSINGPCAFSGNWNHKKMN
ncbi:hypothetical protein HYV11_01070 [Candidatus Dependentiae bacterium]|nr:hypothetical protein [Candidatus Dependentiae bacterium]